MGASTSSLPGHGSGGVPSKPIPHGHVVTTTATGVYGTSVNAGHGLQPHPSHLPHGVDAAQISQCPLPPPCTNPSGCPPPPCPAPPTGGGGSNPSGSSGACSATGHCTGGSSGGSGNAGNNPAPYPGPSGSGSGGGSGNSGNNPSPPLPPVTSIRVVPQYVDAAVSARKLHYVLMMRDIVVASTSSVVLPSSIILFPVQGFQEAQLPILDSPLALIAFDPLDASFRVSTVASLARDMFMPLAAGSTQLIMPVKYLTSISVPNMAVPPPMPSGTPKYFVDMMFEALSPLNKIDSSNLAGYALSYPLNPSGSWSSTPAAVLYPSKTSDFSRLMFASINDALFDQWNANQVGMSFVFYDITNPNRFMVSGYFPKASMVQEFPYFAAIDTSPVPSSSTATPIPAPAPVSKAPSSAPAPASVHVTKDLGSSKKSSKKSSDKSDVSFGSIFADIFFIYVAQFFWIILFAIIVIWFLSFVMSKDDHDQDPHAPLTNDQVRSVPATAYRYTPLR